VTALLVRAARDGHTWLPAATVEAALPAAAVAAALRSGLVVGVGSQPSGPGLALSTLAEEEELLADGLAALAAEGRLAVVAGPAGAGRAGLVTESTERAAAQGGDVAVVDRAERLDVPAALEAVEALPDEALLLLVGDPALLGPQGPGRVLGDLVASGVCPVLHPDPSPGRPGALERLDTEVRAGRLPRPDPEDHTVVVVPVDSDEAAARRAVQVATVSAPRAFDVVAEDVFVLSPLHRGPSGVEALRSAFAEAGAADVSVSTVHDAAAAGTEYPAVVLVLGPSSAGVLDRALVLTAVSLARRHLSVIHGVGADLARAVESMPGRPRRTRLAALLRSASADGPGADAEPGAGRAE
jgi:exodeoxyribonuclease V alpha subunit